MTSNMIKHSLFTATLLLTAQAFAEEVTLDPIVVGADFREQNLSKVAASVSVIGEDTLYDKATVPLAEVVSSTPNVNYSAGASRAKYIQIRGMGERGQFETPVNPSVGLIMDGIDFSNIPLGVSLFDIKQIEVLRGPQGTKFGANALAGIVNIESNEPSNEVNGHVEATVGNYNTKAFGLAMSAPIVEDKLLARFSVYKNTSDGYITNAYLNRDDTNNIDELTAKAKLRWFVSDNHTIDFNYIHVDVDNGYDAFNENNTRTTYTDEPGRDAQKTDAFSLKSTYQVSDLYHVISQASYSTSDLEYSYDEDWTYTGAYYTSFDQYLRDKEQLDFDVRVVSDEGAKLFNDSTAWTVGAYYRKYTSDLVRNNTYFISAFESAYKAESLAAYGQLDIALSQKLTMVAGLRIEQWKTDYSDSDNTLYNDSENLIGGKLGLEYKGSDTQLFYATLSRGYKPGGFNPVTNASGLPKIFQTEALWNVDLGMNSTFMDGKLHNRLNLFYGKRKDQQVGTSYVTASYKYTDYITNAEKGTYYGLETTVDYSITEDLQMYANLGLLQAQFDTFYNPVDQVSKDGRAPAQSPEYQYNLGINYMMTENLTFKTSVEGRGSYYFSNSHDEKSDPYALLNASIEYVTKAWSVILWGRNLTDTDYQTRGYYFDNFGTGDALYTQQGDPLTGGLTLSYDF